MCEMEMAGRGNELTEYLIGVEALGRPGSYSPGDDSTVRNRAFALRKKLHDFYAQEKPEAAIRIELPKGSYCPHFVQIEPGEKLSVESVVSLTPPLPARVSEMPAPERSYVRQSLLSGFLGGVVITALCASLVWLLTRSGQPTAGKPDATPPIVAEALGPLLTPGSDVLICVANPPSFSAHSSGPSLFYSDPGGQPAPRELYAWYREKYPLPASNSLYLTITTNATYWGDSIGAMTMLRTLASAGVSAQILPEKVITVPTLRRRNVVLLGAPEYSPAAAHFLEKCPLTINYINSILVREPGKAPTPLYALKRDGKNRIIEVYGLITVLPSEDASNHQQRTIIFSGVNSAGAQAAAEFFSSAEKLLELQSHLKKEGYNHFPSAWQVVVRAETDDNILLSFRYATHRVIRLSSDQ
ncbi:MAG TPA: hypothetical protein VNQ79_00870 [Blastocatellia bacterium]|nr:hypothetical protein [Blastocatellia bacterium]